MPTGGRGFAAAAAHIVSRQCLVAEMFERRILQRMSRAIRIEQIARQHRISGLAAKLDAMISQDDDVELQPFRLMHGHDPNRIARGFRHTMRFNMAQKVICPKCGTALKRIGMFDQLIQST